VDFQRHSAEGCAPLPAALAQIQQNRARCAARKKLLDALERLMNIGEGTFGELLVVRETFQTAIGTGARCNERISLMMTLLIAALFLSGAVGAAGIIAASLRAYWPAVARVRSALATPPQWQEVRITLVSINLAASGAVLRPDFTRQMRAPARVLRAAA
jgi:hypothetical protein